MKELLQNHTCAIRTAAGELLTSDARGILPPLQWLREDPALLRGAEAADRIVGKAAALLFAHGGVKFLWAECISESAIAFLDRAGISYAYAERVERIMNREGAGMCPMEQKALGIDDPAEAFAVFDGMLP